MNVALLIPTMNRPEFIERTIRYYDSLKSPHRIYIGDASNHSRAQQTRTFLRQVKNVEVDYSNWEGLGIVKTISQLAERAAGESTYCAIQGDDDYFVPSSLSQCAKFLAEHPDYRTAQGRGPYFWLDRPGPYGEIRSLESWWGVNALEQEASVDRLAAFARQYYVLQFSIHRTREFLEDSKYYREIVSDQVGEMLHCFTFALKGKSKFIDCLYVIRNTHEDVYHPDFLDMVAKEHWSSDLHKSIRALGLTLQECGGPSLIESEKLVYEALKLYFDLHLKDEYDRRRSSILRKLRMLLPNGLKRVIRRFVTLDTSDMRLLGSGLGSGKSRFQMEFAPVVSSLTQQAFLQDQ